MTALSLIVKSHLRQNPCSRWRFSAGIAQFAWQMLQRKSSVPGTNFGAFETDSMVASGVHQRWTRLLMRANDEIR